MDTIFNNKESSKATDRYRLVLKLADQMNLKRSDEYVTLSNLIIHYTWEDN